MLIHRQLLNMDCFYNFSKFKS